MIRPSLTSQTDWFYKLIDKSEISVPKKGFVSNPKLYKLDPPAVEFVSETNRNIRNFLMDHRL